MLLLTIGVFGGNDSVNVTQQPDRERPSAKLARTPAATPTKSAEAQAPAKPEACEQVPQAKLSLIAEQAESGAGMKVIEGAAVKSRDYERVWMIAAQFTVTGVSGSQVGV